MKSCILIAIALCLLGCSDEVSPPPVDNSVHLAGFLANSDSDGDNVASYWKDGAYTGLTGENIRSRVTSLYVDGSSVIMAGWKRITGVAPEEVIWQDGVESVIDESTGGTIVASRNNNLFGVWQTFAGWMFNKNGTSQPIVDTAYNIGVSAIALLGDDIYMAGGSSGKPLPPTYYSPQHAQYWKNGQLIFRESETSNAMAIFIHQNDIYVAGQVAAPDVVTSIACYWKNGDRVDLTTGSATAIARSIFVTDAHVYVAGMEGDQAVYWKDGERTVLSNEAFSMANSIFVQGTDVHVGGYQNWHPAYWKNDVREDIENQDRLGQILFVVAGSN